ncbi:YdcF family protein [Antrihabitans spumae]|uniref:YdcF family protein n=1 Tax=Antrihabitans spumae TaxID=3373370 RepID=A0ABW7K4E6_9NOCA
MTIPTSTRRLRRRLGVALLVAVLGVTGFVVALWPVYVDPIVDEPERADAIVVLGGAHDGREELAIRLASQGYAPQVVFSNPYGASRRMQRLCYGEYTFKVSCFEPDPATTRGEGREIRRLAAEQGWTRVIVMTFTPHISRSRYIVGKCFDGELLMVPSRPELRKIDWAWNYVYQSFGYARALFENC